MAGGGHESILNPMPKQQTVHQQIGIKIRKQRIAKIGILERGEEKQKERWWWREMKKRCGLER